MLVRFIFCLLLTCFLSACAVQEVYPNARDPIDVSQVTAFKKAPDFSYEVIGTIRSPAMDTFDRHTIVESAIQGLKRRAAALGANGVIIGNTEMFLAAYMRNRTGTYFFRGMPWMGGINGMHGFYDCYGFYGCGGFYGCDGFPPAQLIGEAIFYPKKWRAPKN